MTEKQGRDLVMKMVAEACERRNTTLKSRQIEAVTEVFTTLTIHMAAEMQGVEDRLDVVEKVLANILEQRLEDGIHGN